ncbi:TetR/AcrR family transcriptional regulator [Sphingorhabdus arenilitoris]|uniref:TetR/AcrR family transcriptional regulator n=1 Tax=Sphingorhabdus arenilitoris TaxID=1490041 RepID=A0ABV8RBR8_9SPHN
MRIIASTAEGIYELLVAGPWDYVYVANMGSKDNSVNIKNDTPRYHHGDLRGALIAAGLELIKERAADDLSLREVARHVGVSATAIYRHFPDKQALLFALCERGAQDMAALQQAAVDEAGGGEAGFRAAGRAYILFALANPGLYRLMMATKASADHYDANASAMEAPMTILHNCVSAVLPAGAGPLQHKVTGLHAWSMVHGISMLMLDGLVAPDGEVIDALVQMPIDRRGQ